MAKERLIKRVYEKGRERTLTPAEKRIRTTAAVEPKPIKKPKRLTPPPPPEIITQPETRKVFAENYELPAHYNTTRVVLIAKDPRWIYAYWEIAPYAIADLKNKYGNEAENANLTLRMYDVTLIDFNGQNANHYFDIEVGYNTNNWYINLWHDGVSYCADIGLKTGYGRFFPLARSNSVQTPRAYYSPRTEQIWMSVTDNVQQAPYIVGRTEPPTKAQLDSTRQQHYAPRKRRIYLEEDEVRHYYAGLTPLLRDIISSRLARFYGKKARGYSFILEGETDEERRAIYSRLPKFGFIKKIILGSSESLLLGASEQFAQPPGASEFVENVPARKFFFEIGTELIVYGRTEPDAEVYLGNQKLQLRNDGTFTLRFALPADGKIPLDFEAISNDKKQKRKITTSVERITGKDPHA